jgi:hypothetical protein
VEYESPCDKKYQIMIEGHIFILEFHSMVISKLIAIQDDIAELLRRSTPLNTDAKQIDGAPSLPITTIPDLESFEDWLKTDDHFAAIVITTIYICSQHLYL